MDLGVRESSDPLRTQWEWAFTCHLASTGYSWERLGAGQEGGILSGANVLDLFIIWSKSLKQLGTEPRQSLIDYRGSREAKVICCWRRIRHKTYFFLREEKEASCGSHHKSTNEEEQDSGENLCGSGMQVLLKAESGTETQRKVFGQQKCNTKHKLAAAWCWGNLKFVMLRRKL